MPNNITPKEKTELLHIIKNRFESNLQRHSNINWIDVESRLEANPGALWSLSEMEKTGGEPDVIGVDEKTGEYIFCDCSPESPKGRRNLCYDREALNSRKANKPDSSAMDLAREMGIDILDEDQYRNLQKLGEFDLKSSSWLKTPDNIRKLGGAIFGDRRFDTVFIYHNGAESYYSARGFRGFLKV